MDERILYFLSIIGLVSILITCSFLVFRLRKLISNDIEKKILEYTKAIKTGSDIAGLFINNNQYREIKEIIDQIVVGVEEFAKSNKMTGEEKHALAKKYYYQICEETGLENYAKLSENTIDMIIKAAVYVMNKEYNNK